MKTIKINFCDFWLDFNPQTFFITSWLQKKYNVEFSENPEFLFYSCFGHKHLTYSGCVKIYHTGEAVTPDFNECDYAIGFDYINFENRYLRHSRCVHVDKLSRLKLPRELANRKFCNFIYSNATSGEGTKIRIDFCKQLACYKQIDCPGKILNNMVDAIEPRFGNWAKGKLDFIKKYKFTIAFENNSKVGYVSEKLMQPLQANSIPIYWGDPEVTREFNPNAFVNCHDYKNFDEVIEYVKYLDNNDDAYMEMLRQPPMQPDYVHDPDKFANFLYAIIERGNVPFPKEPLNRYDAKKQTIKTLLQEASTLQLQVGNAAKAEEHAKLALCLQPNAQWAKDQLIKISKFSDQQQQPVPVQPSSPENTLKENAMTTNQTSPLPVLNAQSIMKTSTFKNYLMTLASEGGSDSDDSLAQHRQAMFEYALLRDQQAESLGDKRFAVAWNTDPLLEDAYRHLLAMLAPQSADNVSKIRLGGANDGGYVMLDPGKGGIAYSFGVSTYSPWDWDMVNRGFSVFQYDGTIEKAPQTHEKLFFHKFNITGSATPAAGTRNISQIFADHKHDSESNIILQMNIEGAEWDFFEAITQEQLLKFSQIIVEFHGLLDASKLSRYTSIFEKITQTHTSVHFHYNNNGGVKIFKNFCISSLFEISFARKADYSFKPCAQTYPTTLDAPCVTRVSDVYIGKFENILRQTPPRHMPKSLHSQYTFDNAVPVIDYYFNNTRHTPLHITRKTYESTINAIAEGKFSYYAETLNYMRSAFERYSLVGKRVLIYGLAGCNCDALALYYGASEVIAVDYNKPICDHPRVTVLSMQELASMQLDADVAISISTFEHDGLGRYGDPLDPDGDIKAMQLARTHVKSDGLLFLAVPTGPDCIAWNAHRIYGPKRLPLLCKDWSCIDTFGFAHDQFELGLGKAHQPVLVLKNNPLHLQVPNNTSEDLVTIIRQIHAHGAFDAYFYTTQCPLCLRTGIDPVSHYVLFGAQKGYDPVSWFNTVAYLAANADVCESGINPFYHYLFHGCQEKRMAYPSKKIK